MEPPSVEGGSMLRSRRPRVGMFQRGTVELQIPGEDRVDLGPVCGGQCACALTVPLPMDLAPTG